VRAVEEGPRSQALPGMGQVRNVRLDHFCEAINQSREVMNAERNNDVSYKQGALAEMHTKGIASYVHGGVVLMRVPGEEKLQVRSTPKEATTANETSDEGAEE